MLRGEGWWRRRRSLHRQAGRAARDRHDAGGLSRRSRPATDIAPILISGATGTLGRAFATICARRNIACRLLDRAAMDIADPASVDAAIARWKPWAIVNASGYVRIDDAESDRERCMRENAHRPGRPRRGLRARPASASSPSRATRCSTGAAIAPGSKATRRRRSTSTARSKAAAERDVLARCPDGDGRAHERVLRPVGPRTTSSSTRCAALRARRALPRRDRRAHLADLRAGPRQRLPRPADRRRERPLASRQRRRRQLGRARGRAADAGRHLDGDAAACTSAALGARRGAAALWRSRQRARRSDAVARRRACSASSPTRRRGRTACRPMQRTGGRSAQRVAGACRGRRGADASVRHRSRAARALPLAVRVRRLCVAWRPARSCRRAQQRLPHLPLPDRPMPHLIVFSHLRWDFVFQRPQHLLSRLARHYPVVVRRGADAHRAARPTSSARRRARASRCCAPHTPVEAGGFHDDQLSALQPMISRLPRGATASTTTSSGSTRRWRCRCSATWRRARSSTTAWTSCRRSRTRRARCASARRRC